MVVKYLIVCLLMGAMIVCSSNGSRSADESAVMLRVTGDVDVPLSLTAVDLDSFPRYDVTATIHERSITFSGVALRDILKRAKPPGGIQVARTIVIARGSDGYTAVLALVELEEDFTDKLVIAADRRDGEMLPPEEAPLRSIVEGEKIATRAVRQLVELEVRLIEEE